MKYSEHATNILEEKTYSPCSFRNLAKDLYLQNLRIVNIFTKSLIIVVIIILINQIRY